MTKHRQPGGNALRAAVVALAACTALTGCAQTGLTGPIVTPDDACSQFRQPIANVAQTGLTPDDLIAPAIGALGGAVAGGLIGGGGRRFDPTGAIIGGLAGALAGAGTRYVQRVQQQSRDREALARAIYNDDINDGQRFSSVRTAVMQLRDCRRRQFTGLMVATRTNRIPRASALQEFQLLVSRRERDDEIVNAALGIADQRVTLYREAASSTQTLDMIAMLDKTSQPLPPVRSGPGSGAPRVQQASLPLTRAVEQLKQQDNIGREEQRRTEEALRTLLI